MLATMMIPNSVGLIPNYMIMAKFGWINTWLPLIVPGLASAFNVFWMRQYMTTVPDEMIEAAQIDGCGPFGIYWRVVHPGRRCRGWRRWRSSPSCPVGTRSSGR